MTIISTTKAQKTLESDIVGKERAIRHLIGEEKALNSAVHRDAAELKLLRSREHNKKIVVASTGETIPHGLQFIDCSSYQTNINLGELLGSGGNYRAGQKLYVVKATEGTFYTDGFLAARWHRGAEVGFGHRGAYHFLHMDESGIHQAEFFLNEITRNGHTIRPSDILIADVEVSDGESSQTIKNVVRDFGNTLKAHYPHSPRWLYGGSFLREHGVGLDPYTAHWLAAYVTDPNPYFIYGKPFAWQHSDGHYGVGPRELNGSGGPCDMSVIL